MSVGVGVQIIVVVQVGVHNGGVRSAANGFLKVDYGIELAAGANPVVNGQAALFLSGEP